MPAATITSSTRSPRRITTGSRRSSPPLIWTTSRLRRRPSAIGSRPSASSSIDKAAPLKKQLAALEAPYREALEGEQDDDAERGGARGAGTPAEKRTPAQKKLAKGLETSTRITWEEVAAAVSANAGRHGASREAEAGNLRDRAIASPPAGARDGTRREEGQEGRDVRAAPRRLQVAWSQGDATAARCDPGLAAAAHSVRLVQGTSRRAGGRRWRRGSRGQTTRSRRG